MPESAAHSPEDAAESHRSPITINPCGQAANDSLPGFSCAKPAPVTATEAGPSSGNRHTVMAVSGVVTSANAVVPDMVAELTAAPVGSPTTVTGSAGDSAFACARAPRRGVVTELAAVPADPQPEIASVAAQIEMIDRLRLAGRAAPL